MPKKLPTEKTSKMKRHFRLSEKKRIHRLLERVTSHIENAKHTIQHSVDTEMVKAYWLIGREIIEEEQNGKARAQYGSFLLTTLSTQLTKRYSRGFGVSTLRDIRQFYLTYADYKPIHHAVRGESQKALSPNLGWLHYRALMRVDRMEARLFYEIEAEKNRWSGRELERQIDSLLFDRLRFSKDKKGLMRLSKKGQEISNPADVIKEPLILEFLEIPESNKLIESNLEEMLISNMQNFLLELGKGFAFVARQKRLSFDGKHFYADLVFYHTILKLYIIIDLKTKPLSHADLGQMQLYVNYFDQEVKAANDNSSIGLILCTKQSKEMVKYFFGNKKQNIFASKYQFHLPTERELQVELKKEIRAAERKLSQKKHKDRRLHKGYHTRHGSKVK